MQLCNEIVTLYNARMDSDGMTAYDRTVISGVSWFGPKKSGVQTDGLKAANQYTLRIPEDADFGGKSYVDAKAYAAADDTSAIFTFGHGDLIVKGIAVEENPRPAGLHAAYADVITITAATDNRRGHAPHFKVVGE